MKKLVTSLVLAAAFLLGSALPASAQVLYGSVVGLVEDPSGSVIPNASITLTNKGTGQVYEIKTDTGGVFTVPNVQPGQYDAKVAASGFRTATRTDVLVTVNTITRTNFRMEVGQLTEQVTVQADATVLQTDKADTHTEINSKQISSLPLPGFRNYQSLINLVPGATPAGFQNSITDTPGRSLTTNINGTNRNNNTTRIDGAASVNLWLPHHAGYVMPAEMVDTVNITTAASDAEQGMAGGAAITLVTKSGTNQLHGSAFEYHDNQRLYARNFFLPSTQSKPVSIYNNFGGTLGGPIKKNKLFFFYSYDNTKQRSGAFGRYSVPEADFRAGDFSRTLAARGAIYDPATGNPDGTGRQPFAGNRIPTARFSAPALKVQSYFPLPNIGGAVDANNYSASAVPQFNRPYHDVKINFNRNEKHMIWGHYGIMKALVIGYPIFGDGVGPAPGADPGTGDTKVQNTSIGHTYTLSPNLLLDGLIGYQRQDQTVRGVDYGKDFSATLGIPGVGGADIREKGFPNITVSGFNGFGVPGWMPTERIEEAYTTSHNLTWTKGSHVVRFGFDGTNFRMTHWQPELGAGPRGAISFNGGPAALGPSQAPNFSQAYAAFLLGQSDQMQKSIQYILMTPREFQFGWYGQDRWQVNRKLTLTMGLRYEYYPLMTRATGKGIERLDPETNKVFLGGRGNVPRNVGVTVSKKLFAPTLGMAYRATEKTVVRAGYGIHYDPLPFSRPLRGFYPLTVNFAFNAPNGYSAVRTLSEGIPAVNGPDLSTGVVDLPAVADMRSPYAGQIHRGYTQSWNFTVERRLPLDVTTSLAYVGTQSTHLLADLDINAGFPGSGQALRPYAVKFNRRVATNMWDGYLSSNYHSLQSAVRKQFSKGVMLQGSYTWSKAINMTDDDGWAGVGWNWAPAFYRNRAAAGYDRRHMFNLGWVYELPFGKGKQWAGSSGNALNHVIGGWSVNGVIQAYTGTPFTVVAPGASLNAPSNTQTADQVGSISLLRQVGPGSNWWDPASFRAITDQRFGSTGRNLMRNPSVWNTDLMISKKVNIKENWNVEFRSEFFNLPNTSHFGGMASTDVTNPNFMRVLSAFGERRIRFGLRLGF